MKAEEFSVWFSGVGRLSVEQRREVGAALANWGWRAQAGGRDGDLRGRRGDINNVNAYHGRLKQWLNRFNGVATKNLPNYLGWRRALEAWGDQATPQSWIKGAIGNGPYQQVAL